MKTLVSILLAGALAGISASAKEAAPAKPIPVEQAAEKIAAGVQLLDVRTQEEWDAGHLKGAKLVPISMEGYADKVKAVLDPKKPVVVYCHSGNRSAMAAKRLREGGFTTVLDMAGGITAWQKEGKPVVK